MGNCNIKDRCIIKKMIGKKNVKVHLHYNFLTIFLILGKSGFM